MIHWNNQVQVNLHSAEELIRCFLGTRPIQTRESSAELMTKEFKRGIIGSWQGDVEAKVVLTFDDLASAMPWVYHEPESYLLKRVIYELMSEVTGKKLPWGILTGIRPGKIVDHWLDLGVAPDQCKQLMQQVYLLEEDKAQILVDIALRQQLHRKNVAFDHYNLYIHIPFCPTRCHYCSFPAVAIEKHRDETSRYIDRVIEELHEMIDYFDKDNIYTVYIGGGTPTALPDEDFVRLMGALASLKLSDDVEFTIEGGRPETITHEKLALMAPVVNRLSINTQTSKDETLAAMGRNHSFAEVKEAFLRAQSYHIPVINTDLILGLPGETEADMLQSLRDVFALEPENVTIHTLAIKKKSALKGQEIKREKSLQETVEKARELCARHGYFPYYLYRQKFMVEQLENIGYAKRGYENKYNMAMMEEWNHTVGIGMGAVSKIFYEKNHFERFGNYKDLRLYCNAFDELMKKKKDFLNKIFDHH